MRHTLVSTWLAGLLVLVLGTGAAAQPQPQGTAAKNGQPVLVGRLTLTEGQVLRYVYEEKDWVATVKDTPFGAEDSLYSDQDGKAEILIPNNTWIRIGGDTQIQGIAFEEDLSEVDVASGMARFGNREGKTIIKATTPFGYVVAPADTRFDLYVGDNSVEVIALKGTVDFVHAKNEGRYEVVSGGSSLIADSRQVTSGDGNVDANWDDWNLARDSQWAKRIEVKGDSYEHLPPQLRDEAYELEENGRWERVYYEGEHRNLWRPHNVGPDWTPYSVGRWFDYYGDQCWIPYEPFGYVTHHYGNWIYVGNYWYWAPPIVHVGISVGPVWGLGFGWYPGRVSWLYSSAYIGWVPLAPFEPYYCRRYWGPASVVVASVALPGISINIGSLHWLHHGVFVPHGSFYGFYGHHGYRNVRITNINRTTIINNYYGSPVVDNRVIRNFERTRDRFRMTDAAVFNKPHRSVVERIDRNQRLAERLRGERVQGDRVLQEARGIRQAQLTRDARVERPRVTNRLVPADQVDRPKSELRMQQRDLVRQERSQRATEERMQRRERQQEQRELRQRETPGQAERQLRPQRPPRERLDQLRQQREEQRRQPSDTGEQSPRQRISPQERRQQQLDERRQQLDQGRRRDGAGTQTRPERVSPEERRQQMMQDRQQIEQRRRSRDQQPQEFRQQDSGARERRLQMEERRQQQMIERQRMQEQRQQMQQRRPPMEPNRQQLQQQRQLQMQEQRQRQQQPPAQRRQRPLDEQQSPQWGPMR